MNSMRSNQEIHGSDRLALFVQSGTQTTVRFSRIYGIIQNFQRCYKFKQKLAVSFRIKTSLSAVLQFREGNRRHPHIAEMQTLESLQNVGRGLADKVNANIGVQKILHAN